MTEEKWIVVVKFSDEKTEQFVTCEPKEKGEFFKNGTVISCHHLSQKYVST